MTREETKTILNRVFGLYMMQSKNLTNTEKSAMLGAWSDTFASDTYEDVSRAVSRYAKSGRPFLPNPSDIVQELSNMEDTDASRLFNALEKAAEMAANHVEHIAIDDLGGLRWSEEYKRQVYFPVEAHYSTDYTQSDFAALPIEVQEYAEDIEGLKHLHREISSNRTFARRRFVDRLPEIRRRTEAADAN